MTTKAKTVSRMPKAYSAKSDTLAPEQVRHDAHKHGAKDVFKGEADTNDETRRNRHHAEQDGQDDN